MRCPLDLEDLNKGSADGKASAVGTTANREYVFPVDKDGSAGSVLALTMPIRAKPATQN